VALNTKDLPKKNGKKKKKKILAIFTHNSIDELGDIKDVRLSRLFATN
jgi:hypothetical protein